MQNVLYKSKSSRESKDMQSRNYPTDSEPESSQSSYASQARQYDQSFHMSAAGHLAYSRYEGSSPQSSYYDHVQPGRSATNYYNPEQPWPNAARYYDHVQPRVSASTRPIKSHLDALSPAQSTRRSSGEGMTYEDGMKGNRWESVSPQRSRSRSISTKRYIAPTKRQGDLSSRQSNSRSMSPDVATYYDHVPRRTDTSVTSKKFDLEDLSSKWSTRRASVERMSYEDGMKGSRLESFSPQRSPSTSISTKRPHLEDIMPRKRQRDLPSPQSNLRSVSPERLHSHDLSPRVSSKKQRLETSLNLDRRISTVDHSSDNSSERRQYFSVREESDNLHYKQKSPVMVEKEHPSPDIRTHLSVDRYDHTPSRSSQRDCSEFEDEQPTDKDSDAIHQSLGRYYKQQMHNLNCIKILNRELETLKKHEKELMMVNPQWRSTKDTLLIENNKFQSQIHQKIEFFQKSIQEASISSMMIDLPETPKNDNAKHVKKGSRNSSENYHTDEGDMPSNSKKHSSERDHGNRNSSNKHSSERSRGDTCKQITSSNQRYSTEHDHGDRQSMSKRHSSERDHGAWQSSKQRHSSERSHGDRQSMSKRHSSERDHGDRQSMSKRHSSERSHGDRQSMSKRHSSERDHGAWQSSKQRHSSEHSHGDRQSMSKRHSSERDHGDRQSMSKRHSSERSHGDKQSMSKRHSSERSHGDRQSMSKRHSSERDHGAWQSSKQRHSSERSHGDRQSMSKRHSSERDHGDRQSMSKKHSSECDHGDRKSMSKRHSSECDHGDRQSMSKIHSSEHDHGDRQSMSKRHSSEHDHGAWQSSKQRHSSEHSHGERQITSSKQIHSSEHDWGARQSSGKRYTSECDNSDRQSITKRYGSEHDQGDEQTRSTKQRSSYRKSSSKRQSTEHDVSDRQSSMKRYISEREESSHGSDVVKRKRSSHEESRIESGTKARRYHHDDVRQEQQRKQQSPVGVAHQDDAQYPPWKRRQLSEGSPEQQYPVQQPNQPPSDAFPQVPHGSAPQKQLHVHLPSAAKTFPQKDSYLQAVWQQEAQAFAPDKSIPAPYHAPLQGYQNVITTVEGYGINQVQQQNQQVTYQREHQSRQQQDEDERVATSIKTLPLTSASPAVSLGSKDGKQHIEHGALEITKTSQQISIHPAEEKPSKLLEAFLNKKISNFTLSTLTHHIVEFCKNQRGSICICDRLDRASLDQITMAYKEIIPAINSLMMHPYGHHVIRKLFKICSSEQTEKLAQRFRGHVLELASVNGFELIGCALRASHILQADLVKEISDYVLKFATDKNGCRLLKTFVECVKPEEQQLIIQGLKELEGSLFTNKFGCVVIQALIQNCAATQITPVIAKLHDHIDELISDQFGSTLVIRVFDYGTAADKYKIIKAVRRRFLDLSRRKYSSALVEQCISNSSQCQRAMLINEVCSMTADVPNRDLYKMMAHPLASNVMQKVISFAEPSQHKILMQKLEPHFKTLQAFPHARNIIKSLMLGGDGTDNSSSATPDSLSKPSDTSTSAAQLLQCVRNKLAPHIQLNDIVNHVLAFAEDNMGAQFIIDKLDSASVEEKAMVFSEILPTAKSMIIHNTRNCVIKKLFEVVPPRQKQTLAECMKGIVLQLSSLTHGSALMECALKSASNTLKVELVSEFHGHLLKSAVTKCGSQLIRTFIENVSPELQKCIINALHGQADALFKSRFGSQVIQSILVHCTFKQTSTILTKLYRSIGVLVQNCSGSPLVQQVFEHGTGTDKAKIFSVVQRRMLELSQKDHSRPLVEKCISSGAPNQRASLINKVCSMNITGQGSRLSGGLYTMMTHIHASKVMLKVIDFAGPSQHQILLQKITPHFKTLKLNTNVKNLINRILQGGTGTGTSISSNPDSMTESCTKWASSQPNTELMPETCDADRPTSAMPDSQTEADDADKYSLETPETMIDTCDADRSSSPTPDSRTEAGDIGKNREEIPESIAKPCDTSTSILKQMTCTGSSRLLEFLQNTQTPNLQLEDLVNSVVEFAKDSLGSQFILDKLKSTTPEEETMVFKEILPAAKSLMLHNVGNSVIIMFFEIGSIEQKEALAQCVKGEVLQLATLSHGSVLMEYALTSASTQLQDEFTHELEGHVTRFSTDQYGSRLLKTFIECVKPEQQQFIMNALKEQVSILFTNEFGHQLIQSILQSGTTAHNALIVAKFIERINTDDKSVFPSDDNKSVFTSDDNKSVFTSDDNKSVFTSDDNMSVFTSDDKSVFTSDDNKSVFTSDDNMSVFTSEFGCRVTQSILEHSTAKLSAPILAKLHIHVDDLMQKQYGINLLQYVLEHGTPANKYRIIKAVRAKMLDLSQRTCSSAFVEHCISCSSGHQRAILINGVCSMNADGPKSDLYTMITHPLASKVMQKVIDFADSSQCEILQQKLAPHLKTVHVHTNAQDSIDKLGLVGGESKANFKTPKSVIYPSDTSTPSSASLESKTEVLDTSNSSSGVPESSDHSTAQLLQYIRDKQTPDLQLKDIVGHIVELAEDTQGSQFIVEMLDSARAEGKAMVLNEILPTAQGMIMHKLGNPVIKKLFEVGSMEQKQTLAQYVKGQVIELASLHNGCAIIKGALESASSSMKDELMKELNGQVVKFAKKQRLSKVLQAFIECVNPEQHQFILDELKGKEQALFKHPHACYTMAHIMQHCNANQRIAIFAKFYEHLGVLIKHPYGSILVEQVFEHGQDKVRSMILTRICGDLLTYSRKKFSSPLIEKCISHSTRSERAMLVDAVVSMDDVGTKSSMHAMMNDQFAGAVINKLFSVMTVDEVSQCKVLLRKVEPHIKSVPAQCAIGKLKQLISSSDLQTFEDFQTSGEMQGGTNSTESDMPPRKLLPDFLDHKLENLQLSDIESEVFEFSSDPRGSQFIMDKLESAHVREKEMVMKEILPDARILMMHEFGNHVMQYLFKISSYEEKSLLAESMQGYVGELALDQYGSAVVQRAIICSTSAIQEKLMRELDVLNLAKNGISNNLLQKIIECVKHKQQQIIIDSLQIQTQAYALFINPITQPLVTCILKHCATQQTVPIIDKAINHFKGLVQTVPGSKLIGDILQYGSEEDKSRIIQAFHGNVLTLSRNKISRSFLINCLTHASPAHRALLICEVCSMSADGKWSGLYKMIKNKVSIIAMEKIIDVADPSELDILMRKLQPHFGVLSAHKVACSAIAKLKNAVAERCQGMDVSSLDSSAATETSGQQRSYTVAASPLLEDYRNGFFTNLQFADMVDHVTEFSEDQIGSQFILHNLEGANPFEKSIVFKEIFPKAKQMMMHEYGNHVIQSFLDYGSVKQQQRLNALICSNLHELSLDQYGSTVIQKAISCCSMDIQNAIVAELDVMRCSTDPIGCSLLERIIECLGPSQLQVVIDAFKGQEYTLFTHTYGFQVIECLLENCTAEQTSPILDKFHEDFYSLVTTFTGSNVVQQVLEHGCSEMKAEIISAIRGKVLALSRTQYGSYFMEECLIHSQPCDRAVLIDEVCAMNDDGDGSALCTMVKNKFARKVMKKMIDVSDQSQYDLLIERTLPFINT